MSSTLTRIDTIVQFTQGSATPWNDVTVPVPMGAVVIDIVNKIMKEGDGTTLYANLPVCLDYNFGGGASGAVVPQPGDLGTFAIANNSMYSPSTIKLTDILNTIASLNASATAQQTRINALTAGNLVAEVSAGTPNGTIVICANGQYAPGTETLAQLIANLIVSATVAGSSMHITDLVWYSDAGLTQPIATQDDLNDSTTYYCQVTGWHDTAQLRTVNFGLSTLTSGVTISNSQSIETCSIIASVYGGQNNDMFLSVATDASGNIFAAGYTNSEGTNIPTDCHCLIVKFKPNMIIEGRKTYGGSGADSFNAIAVDAAGNVFAAGDTASEGTGTDCLVVKFDTNLNVLDKQHYGGTGFDEFLGICVDKSNNVTCVGSTSSEGAGAQSALIIKFDNNLNMITRKIYYGAAGVTQFQAVTSDVTGNIIAAGYTTSEGSGGADALVVKFDSNLNIITRKVYGGADVDGFYGVATDSSSNVICVGNTYSEGTGFPTYCDALVVKFDINLNISARMRFGGIKNDVFQSVVVDQTGDMVFVGYTASESVATNCLVVKTDNNLNILSQKYYGGTAIDSFNAVAVDPSGNYIFAGGTSSSGSGGLDGLVLKVPETIPAGTFSGTVLPGLVLYDANLSSGASSLTLGVSALQLSLSTTTLATSALTIAQSKLAQITDVVTAAAYVDTTSLITTSYATANTDVFNASAIDSSGNIIAVGYSSTSPLACKFDQNFNPIARILLSGDYSGEFNDVTTDNSGNVICVGGFNNVLSGNNSAFIVQFNPTLSTIIAQGSLSGTGDQQFEGVCIDPSGNYICVGYTTSQGAGAKDCYVVKFNSTGLAVISQKTYGGSGNDQLNSVAVDSTGNAICVGITASEGVTTSGLILKLDSNLNMLSRKYYTSMLGSTTEFWAVAVDSANTILCSGRVVMSTGNKGLIVTFTDGLTLIADYLYGSNAGATEFTAATFDPEFNLIVGGRTNAEGSGGWDAIVLKLSSSFAILGRKVYGSVGTDADVSVNCTSTGNIVLAGYAVVNGSTDAIITELPGELPAGLYTNKYFTGLALADSNLSLTTDTPVSNVSASTLATSTLTFAASTLTIAAANGAITTDITLMNAVGTVFEVSIASSVAQAGEMSLSFNVLCNDGNVQTSKAISVNVHPCNILESVYGGTANDYFYGVVVDASGNIFAAGYTYSEGTNIPSDCHTLIVKFDTNLNILTQKYYGGSNNDMFLSIAVDLSNDIVCVGSTASEGSGGYDCLVVKFDNNLNILAREVCGGTGTDKFLGVTVDTNNNILCCGSTTSEGTGTSALIVKFDNNLNVQSQKYYGVANVTIFNEITTDSNSDIICVGSTTAEGAGNADALVMKFDDNLNMLARKVYGGSGNDYFYGVATDSSNNIFCCGSTTSEGIGFPTYGHCLVIKFDTNLNIQARKVYGGTANDYFYGVAIDQAQDVVCVGLTYSEAAVSGNPVSDDGLVVKFDNNLNIVGKKIYGGTGNDSFFGVVIDNNNNIIGVGATTSAGSGVNDAFITKLPSIIPSGTFAGINITSLSWADSNLTLNNSALTLAASTMTLSPST